MISLDFCLNWPGFRKFRRINSVAWTGQRMGIEINHYRDNGLVKLEFDMALCGDHAPRLRLLLGVMTHEFELSLYSTSHH